MITFGYACVSSDGLMLGGQLAALRTAGAERVFEDEIGDARADRPELARLLARIGKGDRLIVVRLDRLARSTRDLLDVIATLHERGASLASLREPWADTTGDGGRLLAVLGGLAEFERELVVARMGERRDRAEAQGLRTGRPPKLTPQQQAQGLADLGAGRVTQADLARRHDVSESTISRLVARQTAKPLRRLDAETEWAARAFLRRLKGKYAPVEALLYGSRARGDHAKDSDMDIAVILKGRRGNRYRAVRDLSDAAHDAMMETGIVVQPLPIWKCELERPDLFDNPDLLERIKRDGLRL